MGLDYFSLEKQIRLLVNDQISADPNIIAAYSDGSFSRKDMVLGSDIDIAYITSKKRDLVERKIIGDQLYEWAFMPLSYYKNIQEIISDAGFYHDLKGSIVWYDPKSFITHVKDELGKEGDEKKNIQLRVNSQLQVVKKMINVYSNNILENNLPDAFASLIVTIRSLFAIPTARLNKPVTNCRAYLYSARDSNELGFDGYADNIMSIFTIINDIDEYKIKNLLLIGQEVYKKSDFPEERINTFLWHFKIAEYLISNGNYIAALWPILFWTQAGIHEANLIKNQEMKQSHYERMNQFISTIGLVSQEDHIRLLNMLKEIYNNIKLKFI